MRDRPLLQQSERALQEYRGVPNETTKKDEKTRWQRFLEYVFPKLKQAEALLDAKIRLAKAEADLREAEAHEKQLSVVQLARELEQKRMERANYKVLPSEEIQKDVEDLNKLIGTLSSKFGTQICFIIFDRAGPSEETSTGEE